MATWEDADERVVAPDETQRLLARNPAPVGSAMDQVDAINRADRGRYQAPAKEMGSTGSSVAGTGGAVGGALAGAAVGMVFGPIGAGVGAIIGSLVGSSAGTYAGTQYDIDQFGRADISETEAYRLIKDRLIENAIYDVGGNLLLLGGGKILRVTGASGRINAVIKSVFGEGKSIKEVGTEIRKNKVGDLLTEGHGPLREINPKKVYAHPSMKPYIERVEALAKQAAEAGDEAAVKRYMDLIDELDVLDAEKAKLVTKAVGELSQSGFVPTAGQVSGYPSWLESILRKLDPNKFKMQERALAETAEEFRDKALGEGAKKIENKELAVFLEDSFPDAKALAGLSERLRSDRVFREQYYAKMAENPKAIALMEQAHQVAKMALTVPQEASLLSLFPVPTVGGALLFGGPKAAAVAALLALLPRILSTAATTANKGIINRAKQVTAYLQYSTKNPGKGAAMPQAIIGAIQELSDFADVNGISPKGKAPEQSSFSDADVDSTPSVGWDDADEVKPQSREISLDMSDPEIMRAFRAEQEDAKRRFPN